MTSDYIDIGFMPPASAYNQGPEGSDFGFGSSQNTTDSGAAVDGLAMTGYTSAPGPTSEAMQAFPGLMPSPPLQNGATFETHRPHRLSVGSHGNVRVPSMARHNSFAVADTTSPDGQRIQAPTTDLPRNILSADDSMDGAFQAMPDDAKPDETQGNVPPAWSELKTKAGKERKRLPLACIACRRKKIRCSGEKPACKHCLRSRIPCVYKVTTRKAAPRTDYMAMLDKRLKRMEDRVIKTIPKDEQGIVTSTGRAVVKPPLPPAPPKTTTSRKRAATEAFGNELEEWAENKGKDSVSKQATTSQASEGTEKPKDAGEQNLLLEGADKLPTKDIQEHLAEVFFDYVYGQSYHLLHKPSFMRKLAAGEVPPVLMLAVCAISARFSSHPFVCTEPAFLRGDAWATAAREIALRRFDTPNITILIVYLILGLHEFGTCQGGRSWMFGGMAQRMAYALQLHRDLDHDPKEQTGAGKQELTFTDREIRRRTMWSCFLMDRFNSSGTDRPIFVGEQYIRAQLPIKEDFYQMEITGPTEDLDGDVPNPVESGTGQISDAKANMGVAAYLIRLVSIWGSLIAYLNLGGRERDTHPMWAEQSRFQGINRAVTEWKQNLPEALHHTSENLQNHASEKTANQFLFLHIVYNQILLFMNRFALPPSGRQPTLPKEMPEEFIAEASRTASEAANQISTLIHESMDHLVVAPFAGYCAFFSSTVHIQGAFSKNAALEASSKQNLAWNVKYLTKMKKYWGMFHFVTENLRDLYRRHADAARFGVTAGKEGEQAIFQYGDWFDRYPHGVSGTDYEEPSTDVKKEPGSDAVLGQKSDLQTVEEFFSKLSPPSRAAHLHAQQQSARKAAKSRKAAQDDGKAGAQSGNTQASHHVGNTKSNQGQQQSLPQQQQQHQEQVTHDLAANIDAGFAQNSIAYPPGFQPPPNPLVVMTPPQQFMSQLDRQMVLNSYTNVNQPLMDGSTGMNLDHFDYNAFVNSQQHHVQPPSSSSGYWGDQSTAWFLPFNMEPPAIGDDNNLFSAGNFDWSNNFAGFGDMDMASNMAPTGFTLDAHGQHDGMGGDQRSN